MAGPERAALILGGAEAWREPLRAALASRGVSAEVCALDDCTAEAISRAVVGAEEKLGALDALVYCASGDGEAWNEMLLDIDEPEWDALMNRRVKGFFLACKYALPYLIGRESPRIVLLMPESPPAGACGLHEYAAAAACRAAVEHMSAELSVCSVCSACGISVEGLTFDREGGGWLEEVAERCG